MNEGACMFDDIPQNLEILAEECAEVIQMKSKITRFGIDDYHPKNKMPNREAFEQEIGDVLAMIEILIGNGILTKKGLADAKQRKLDKLGKWYSYEK